MTLMELLVATALVGIVMVGTLSVDSAVHRIRKTTSDSGTVALQTSATMLRITTDVAQAVGDAQNPGILDCRVNNVNYPSCQSILTNPTFCVRQDISDINVYTDDKWVCYWKPLTTQDPQIYRCAGLSNPGECNTSNEVVGTVACDNVTCSSAAAYVFSITANPFSFNIDITNRSFPTQPYDINKPQQNPQYQLSSHISPAGHSY